MSKQLRKGRVADLQFFCINVILKIEILAKVAQNWTGVFIVLKSLDLDLVSSEIESMMLTNKQL